VFGALLVLMLEKTHVQYVITPGTKILYVGGCHGTAWLRKCIAYARTSRNMS
jgi:hypothetical protein